jgi:UDP-glucose:(heptosyl)LPS alpha-1,3-glucosyltransferase
MTPRNSERSACTDVVVAIDGMHRAHQSAHSHSLLNCRLAEARSLKNIGASAFCVEREIRVTASTQSRRHLNCNLRQYPVLEGAPRGLPGVPPVEQQRLLQVCEVMAFANPPPQIEILTASQMPIPTHRDDGIPSHHHRRVTQAVAGRERLADGRGTGRQNHGAQRRSVLVDLGIVAADHCERRLLLHCAKLSFKARRKRHIVRVHPCDKLSTRDTQSLVQSVDKSRTRRRVQDDPWIGPSDFGEEGLARRRSTVINDDKLEILEALGQDTVRRLGDELRTVPHRHQHADSRSSLHTSHRGSRSWLPVAWRRWPHYCFSHEPLGPHCHRCAKGPDGAGPRHPIGHQLRIALAVERFDRASGGQAIWARNLADFLKGRGHEIHVVAARFDAGDLNCHPVQWHWSPLRRAQAFNAAIAAIEPDAVHDSGVACYPGVLHPQTGSALHSLSCHLAAAPTLRRLRAMLSPKMIWLRHEMRKVERAQIDVARRVVAISPLVEQLLKDRLPRSAGKTVCIPNGVDTKHFAPGTVMQRDGSVLRIAAAAHNPALKGLDTVLSAISLLREQGVRVQLDVAGFRPDDTWRRLAEHKRIADCVSFLGLLDDMRPLYHAADVFVHATRWDAYSLVTLEAMACGLPVVTTAACGAKEAIVHGVSGYVVEEPTDVASIARHISELRDERRRSAVGLAAREAALARDIERNHAAVEATLLDCVDRTR